MHQNTKNISFLILCSLFIFMLQKLRPKLATDSFGDVKLSGASQTTASLLTLCLNHI